MWLCPQIYNCAVNGKYIIERQTTTHCSVIDVAVHAAHGLKGFELIEYTVVTNVAGVPYLVTVGKVIEYSRREVRMRIGQ